MGLDYAPFSGKEALSKRLNAIYTLRLALDRREDLKLLLKAEAENLSDKQQEYIFSLITDGKNTVF
ncbi:MAG: hypothetical protein LRY55_06785 [Leadbetterella sp.]|nr:hypothetical protein [Leadbetterella sp.]